MTCLRPHGNGKHLAASTSSNRGPKISPAPLPVMTDFVTDRKAILRLAERMRNPNAPADVDPLTELPDAQAGMTPANGGLRTARSPRIHAPPTGSRIPAPGTSSK